MHCCILLDFRCEVKTMTVVRTRQRMSFQIIILVRNTCQKDDLKGYVIIVQATRSNVTRTNDRKNQCIRWIWQSVKLRGGLDTPATSSKQQNLGLMWTLFFHVSFSFLVYILPKEMKPWKVFCLHKRRDLTGTVSVAATNTRKHFKNEHL